MSKSDAWEQDFNLLTFNNVDAAAIGDAGGLRGSAVAGSLYLALHTASPGEGGTQAANEAAYPGYGRVGVPRSALGWTCAGNSVSNAAAVVFAECGVGGGPEVLTHWSVGVASSGATKMLRHGALPASRTVSQGITPYFPAGTLVLTED